jgi:DNA processing protein
MDASLRDALALSLVPGVGPAEHRRRVLEAGSCDRALAAFLPVQADEARVRADEYLRRGAACGAECVTSDHAHYPAAFHALRVPPPVLWLLGAPGLAAQRSVAIVGTRGASASGLRFARELARTCAEAGVAVVSGLARGIDGAAHEGALEVSGTTIAVLGTGVDVHYPPRHRALQTRIAEEGLLLSEVPPGERGHAGTFPQRNRLIAALGEVTVVVEAGRESGALITARVAEELGRTVCAVPGSVHAPECIGSNQLIRDGAQVICSPDDLLAELQLERPVGASLALEGDAAACWDALQQGSTDVAVLAVRAGLDLRRANVALAALELHGLVDVDLGGLVRPLVTSASA